MLDHLEDNIHHVIADIRPQVLEKVIENWTSRLDYIRASRGSPMPEIIFKIKLYSTFTGLCSEAKMEGPVKKHVECFGANEEFLLGLMLEPSAHVRPLRDSPSLGDAHVRDLVAAKDTPCMGAIHVKSVESSIRWYGVEARREGYHLRCHPCHLTVVQNDEVRRQKHSSISIARRKYSLANSLQALRCHVTSSSPDATEYLTCRKADV
ncbi:hypothetical protein TNCV_2993351 [Trichonephila clavipes]|nr:hypothetical protein TNCV_2993351 [Trichonephila clavipes]